MNSRLYTGFVAHARTRPKKNSFRYGVYFLYLDLAELDELDTSLAKFAHNGRALVRFRDVDHGPRDGSPLRPWIDALLAGRVSTSRAGASACSRSRACWASGSTRCRSGTASTRTARRAPCSPRSTTPSAITTTICCTTAALFSIGTRGPPSRRSSRCHPSSLMDARYEFAFSEPGDKLSVSIHDFVAGPLLLTASLQLTAEPLTDAALSRVVRRYGPMSARAWVLIHMQAIRIVSKGIPYIPPSPAPRRRRPRWRATLAKESRASRSSFCAWLFRACGAVS